MKEDPPLGAKCKDKFLIQTTLITPERESVPIGDLVSLLLVWDRNVIDRC